MNRAMYAAASGMVAQERNLDVIANDLANADVVGFKRATVRFASVGNGTPLGTTEIGVMRSFAQGKLVKSGGPFDVAIQGQGFFVVERRGERGFTRAGEFSRAANGRLENDDGWALAGVRIPPTATAAKVAPDGGVTVTIGGMPRSAGRIELATFDAPEHLRAVTPTVYASSSASGAPRAIAPGGARGPRVAFGMLERANVSIVEEMMAILTAQRAYEANSKGVQAADEMQRIANNLQRG